MQAKLEPLTPNPQPLTNNLLSVDHIVFGYGATPVLRDVSLAVHEGEIVALLGPSGCGKSSLLRVIVGLETEYQGTVRFAGTPLDAVPVHERGFGLMFQEFALFPHRTVGENVAFGLRMQGLPRQIIAERVEATLELVGLRNYAARTIFELSGGERQRVALARSLAPQPRLLLLDEPLGALDRTLRERLTEELRLIVKRIGLTSIYVTHDQAEAFAVADRLIVMDQGQIIQSGTPAEVYRQPASVFVARFLGLENIVPGTVEARQQQATVVQTALGRLTIGRPWPELGREVQVVVRPEAARLASEDMENTLQGVIVRTTFRGATERVVVRHASGIELEVDLPAGLLAGHPVVLKLRPEALALVPA